MPIYTRSCLIRTSVQDLFDFHLDTRNVTLVQPPGFAVVQVKMPPESEAGAETRLTVRVLGLVTQHWLIQWAEVQSPRGKPARAQLVDNMLEGPFPSFHQEHIFTEEGAGSRLTDRVTFRPPWGLIGWLFLPVIYLQLAFMFAWRHPRTRELLEAKIPTERHEGDEIRKE